MASHTADGEGFDSDVGDNGHSDIGAQRARREDLRVEAEIVGRRRATDFDRGWRFDKSISLPGAFAIGVQIVLAIVFLTKLSGRVDHLEEQVSAMAWQAEKIIRIEEQVSGIKDGISEIKRALIPPATRSNASPN